MQLKKLLAILTVMLIAITADAQIKYHPIAHFPNELDARLTYPVPDRSSGRAGDLCAIIKIMHTDMNFTFDIGSLVVNKTVPHTELGELWVYVPVGTNRIKISHPKYGSLDTPDGFYWFEGGLKCQSGQVYRIRLETQFVSEDEDIIVDKSHEQKVQFRTSIANSRIEVRGISFTADGDGMIEIPLPIGKLHYRVSSADYYDSDGVVETQADAGTQTVNVTMQHRQGILNVKVDQDNATVRIDGEEVGKTPLPSTLELPTGSHTMVVTCPNFRTETRTVTIEDGKIMNLSLTLVDGAVFTLDTRPTGSVLYINGEKKGTVPQQIELASGDYNLKFTHNRYKDFNRNVHLDSSKPEQTFSLTRIYQQKNSGYAQVGLQAGSLMSFGATLGGYISNVNVEASYLMGLGKSEDLYWNYNGGTSREPIMLAYSNAAYGFKFGYGIILGTRMRITPQVGATIVSISGKGGGETSKCNVTSGALGARFDYALVQGVGLFAAPELDFAMSKSPVYKQLSEVSSKIKGWGTGFNVRAGVTFFF